MFLRNCWYIAAHAGEVGRSLLGRRLLDEPIVMFRTEAGEAIAFHDRCAHRSFPLSKGTLIGDHLQCGYHGMTFDAGGKCVEIPGYEKVPDKIRVRRYPLIEKWNYLWIWMGDADRMDEDLLPDFHWVTKEGWIDCPGYLHVKANYQLLIDNLLDLSHETYVHGSTLGNKEVAETPVETFTKDGMVVVSRFMRDVPAPPMYVKTKGWTTNIDRHQHVYFSPPAFVDIDSRSYPTGTTDDDNAIVWRPLNALTPETETSTHYFWDLPRGFAPGQEMTDLLHAQVTETFDQDAEVLEAQQRMLIEDPGFEHVNIVADAGPMLARRMMDDLMKDEAALAAAE